MEKYLTVKAVCEMLDISRQTLYRYIKEGKIQAFKVEKAVRIPADQFLNKNVSDYREREKKRKKE